MRYAKNLFTVALVMFFISGMAGLTFAAPPASQPPSSQPPSSSNHVPFAFPDLRMIGIIILAETGLHYPEETKLNAGEQVRIGCGYKVCGCFQNKVFSIRVDIDGAFYYEKEGSWVPSLTTNPGACSPEHCYIHGWPINAAIPWKATPGNHTITCILDSQDNIYEGSQNELNNTESKTVIVPWPLTDKIKDIETKPPIPVPTQRVR